MPIKVPVVQTGLEASIQAAAKKAGRSMKIDMGAGAKSIDGLSQPLGRITGKADQFTKSMEAANARVLAFGASVGVLSAITRGFQALVKTTIEVEKQLISINSILNTSTAGLESFKKTIFEVARNTEQSFGTVATAALELSRQGLKADEVTRRLNDALVLSRLSGLGASEAVSGLTAAINNFNSAGLSSAQILNKLSAAAISAAVSEKDLIEGIKRSGSVATQAGVSFDELIGVITAVQAKTARGGAVIGNSFKTIFTRIQSIEKLKTMQNLGIEVTDAGGEVLGATKLIQNLAKALAEVPDARRLQIAENLVGKFQIAPFLSILDDYSKKTSTAIKVTKIAANATNEAYTRNTALSQALSAVINDTVLNVKELANTLGELGVTDNLKNILSFFSSLVGKLGDVLEGEGVGNKFAKGIVKGIGNIISGPGLAIFGAILTKLTIDLVRFGSGSLKTFFGLNRAAQAQATLQGQIASTLLGNADIQKRIMAIENSSLSIEQKKLAQTKFFTIALNEQMAIMTRMQSIAARVAPGVMRGTRGRGAGGYIPNFNATMGYGSEQADINRGVGGAPKSARPVTMPNFNFGGGQRGTMVANSSEYVVPNFGGSGGSAVFNQNMASSMGLPAGARKIGAAGGYIPNFVKAAQTAAAKKKGVKQFNVGGKNFALITAKRGPDKLDRKIYVNQRAGKKPTFTITPSTDTTGIVTVPTFQIPTKGASRRHASVSIDETSAKLSKHATTKAVENAKLLSGRGDMPRPLQRKYIEQQLNPGSVKGMAGTIFEASLKAMLSDRHFADTMAMTHTSLIDFPRVPSLYKTFGIPQGMARKGVEVKGTGATSLITDAARKFWENEALGKEAITFRKGTMHAKQIGDKGRNALGLTAAQRAARNITSNTRFGDLSHTLQRRIERSRLGFNAGGSGPKLATGSASGYIPNYADPLQNAIGRERAAGLPISQIRVNQSPRLRNAGNPQGLGVTNLRDEPTGRIPNYAKTSTAPAEGAMGGLLMKLIGVQMGFSMLSGVLGEVTEENKGVAKSLRILNMVIMAAVTAQMMGGVGGIGKGIGSVLGTFGPGKLGRGGLVTKGRDMMSTGMGAMRDRDRAARLHAGAVRMGKGSSPAAKHFGAIASKSPLPMGLKVVGGALLRLAGPIGLAATALMVWKKVNDKATGATDALANAEKKAGDAAKYAAKELSKLTVPSDVKEEHKERSKKEAQRQMHKIDALDSGMTAFVTGGWAEGGLDKRLREELEENVLGTLTGGVRSTVVSQAFRNIDNVRNMRMKRVQEEGGTGHQVIKAGKWTMRDYNSVVAELDQMQRGLDLMLVATKVEKSLSPEQRSRLTRAYEAEDLATRAGDPITQEQRDELFEAERPIEQAARDKGVNTALLQSQVRVNLQKEGGAQVKIDKIRGDIAKLQVKTEIELVKIRGTYITDAEKALNQAKAMNSLSNSEIILREKGIKLNEMDRKTSSDIADLLIAQVDTIQKLDLDAEKELALKEKIQGTDLEKLNTIEKQKEILDEIFGIENKESDERKALLKFFNSQVRSLTVINRAKQKGLELSEDERALTADIVSNITQASKIRGIRAESRERVATREIDLDRIKLQTTRDAATRGLNVSDSAKAKAELAYTEAIAKLDIQKQDVDNLLSAEKGIEGLIDKFKGMEEPLKKLFENITPAEIERLGGLSEALGKLAKELRGTAEVAAQADDQSKTGRVSPENFIPDVLKFAETVEGGVDAAELARKKAEADIKASEGALAVAGSFKTLSTLIAEFSKGLKEAREKLKFDMLFARSGGDMISNLNERLTNQDMQSSKGAGGVGVAFGTEASVNREMQDQLFLARTATERREIENQLPLLTEEFQVLKDIARLQDAGTLTTETLVEMKQKLLEIEKRRLALNDGLGAQLKNEFVFTQEEIQRELNSSLVDTARTFVDTISQGLVDAIAKGENLASILRGAATDFFRGLAQNQMDAAFKQITSALGGGGGSDSGGGGGFNPLSFLGFAKGGIITGGSGNRDDRPILATSGEFVIRKGAVEKYGAGFLEELNAGRIGQMQRGGHLSPGTYGQGAISGKRDLLDYATQSYTSGRFDQIRGGAGFGSVALEPQSVRLTRFGAEGKRGKLEQRSKETAFGLYAQQIKAEEAAKEAKKRQGEGLMASIMAAVGAVAFSGLVNKITTGNAAGMTANPTQKRIGKAIPVEDGEIGGGDLGSLFTSFLAGFRDNDPTTFGGVNASGDLLPDVSNMPQRRGGPRHRQLWATGGPVGGIDTVPAMLSEGEFVMNPAATENIGRGKLSAMNAGSGGGGDDNAVVARLDELIAVTDGNGETVINITVNSDGTETQDTNGDERQQTLAVKIKDVVRSVIEEEKRLGGSLRRA